MLVCIAVPGDSAPSSILTASLPTLLSVCFLHVTHVTPVVLYLLYPCKFSVEYITDVTPVVLLMYDSQWSVFLCLAAWRTALHCTAGRCWCRLPSVPASLARRRGSGWRTQTTAWRRSVDRIASHRVRDAQVWVGGWQIGRWGDVEVLVAGVRRGGSGVSRWTVVVAVVVVCR